MELVIPNALCVLSRIGYFLEKAFRLGWVVDAAAGLNVLLLFVVVLLLVCFFGVYMYRLCFQ